MLSVKKWRLGCKVSKKKWRNSWRTKVTDKRLVNYFGYNYYHMVKKEKKNIVQAFKNNKKQY